MPGHLAWEPVPGNVFLGTLLRNLVWEPALWNIPSKRVLANLWELWEPVPGKLACKPLLAWEPCHLFLGTLRTWLGNLFLRTSDYGSNESTPNKQKDLRVNAES